MTEGDKFYVLWRNRGGDQLWTGPYDTFSEAMRTTPMRDRQARAFVTMIGADNSYSVKLDQDSE